MEESVEVDGASRIRPFFQIVVEITLLFSLFLGLYFISGILTKAIKG